MKSLSRHKKKTRFSEEQLRKRKKRNRKIAFGILLLFLVFFGAKFTRSTLLPAFKKLPLFHFRKIVTNATPHISVKAIRRLVGRPSHKNLFDVNLEKIKNNLKKNPWVLDVQVRRLYPDRIHIDIIEKKPVAILSATRLYFLDSKGSLIARLEPGNVVSFPIISGLNKKQIKNKEKILYAYDLIETYKKNVYLNRWPLSEVNLKKKGVTLYTKKPAFEIRLGKRFPQLSDHAKFLIKLIPDCRQNTPLQQGILP